MPVPEPETSPKITLETIARMSAEVVHVPLKEKDRKAVADLLQSLAEDMTALRTLNVGENEPASLYGAVEVEP